MHAVHFRIKNFQVTNIRVFQYIQRKVITSAVNEIFVNSKIYSRKVYAGKFMLTKWGAKIIFPITDINQTGSQ